MSRHRALGLAARDAARRFTSRRRTAEGRREAWRPVVLRWRQWRKRLASAPAGRAARTAGAVTFSQLHVHFATYLGDRVRHERVSAPSLAAPVNYGRFVLDRHFASVRHNTLHLQSSRANRPLSTIDKRKTSPQGVSPIVAPAMRLPRPATPSLVHPHAFRPRRDAMSTPRETRRAKQSEERIIPLRTPLHPRKQSLRMVHRRAPLPANDAAHVLASSKAPRFRFESDEELIWRRAPRRSADVADDAHDSAHSESLRRTSSRSMATGADSASPSIERPIAPLLTKLDPAVLDRLTDHVIRRVEQRIRIERERRGL